MKKSLEYFYAANRRKKTPKLQLQRDSCQKAPTVTIFSKRILACHRIMLNIISKPKVISSHRVPEQDYGKDQLHVYRDNLALLCLHRRHLQYEKNPDHFKYSYAKKVT